MKPNYEALQRLLDPVDSFSRTPGFFFVLEHVYVLMLNVLQFSESDPRLQNVFISASGYAASRAHWIRGS